MKTSRFIGALLFMIGFGMVTKEAHIHYFPDALVVLDHTPNLGDVPRSSAQTLKVRLFNLHLTTITYQPYSEGCSAEPPKPREIGPLQSETVYMSFNVGKHALGAGTGEVVIEGMWGKNPYAIVKPFTFNVTEAANATGDKIAGL